MAIDFSIILHYFVEIYIHSIEKDGMCRVARRNDENKRTKIVEGRRIGMFFTFYLKIVGVYDNGNFYKENYITAKN